MKPVQQKLRRQPYHLRKKIKEKLHDLEEKGIIESVDTPQEWISNIVVTPKSSGDIRICLDAREINKAIQKEKFPIPTVDSLLDSMSGCKFFSKIDLKNAYTQIELSEEARKLTNFITEEGIKRYTRLIYGISNASEIFQRCLEQTLGGIESVRFISDDTIVFSKTLDEHFKCLENLFNRLTECGLTINKSKCEFLKTEIKFLELNWS